MLLYGHVTRGAVGMPTAFPLAPTVWLIIICYNSPVVGTGESGGIGRRTGFRFQRRKA